MGEQVCRFFTNQGGFFMSKDTSKDSKQEKEEEKEKEEDSKSLSPQKEVKGRPAPADYKKAE